jgi:hypothetical protein
MTISLGIFRFAAEIPGKVGTIYNAPLVGMRSRSSVNFVGCVVGFLFGK